ncbi:Rhodanese-like domain-containing protein [Yarrowia lipolytica]|uniref:YALI0F29667p n=2 Tax=Yarrowia lipolytica TaxID=4952 RepID=Q6BZZ2_YARLI|nr:YALI0F29667p [Yarrowia lipolytica CLIB122]AOW07873.1 hypothetical protein YALI1_F37234g [Yarrowia lipolytica]KAB8282265.1 Rhodanese-like domain-containing protein [Yarrowia lipolytica]KAE8172349.1 Rhodanese-like domain-containing protein [Yarrowia lipolytica]KAJ8055090.1 Rhodanese-like domain-containing protein [Yarrowia lipolytica]QNP99612.1 Thiosulfate:glutathione sulfurtransferase [Yarrowia lipolytica]|eukprot:XP_506020.1 YALI0F29667p [Yarrowia lipolytica CLIB122]
MMFRRITPVARRVIARDASKHALGIRGRALRPIVNSITTRKVHSVSQLNSARVALAAVPHNFHTQLLKRRYSALSSECRELTYPDIKALSDNILKGDNDNVILVDVREPDEFKAGHIPGAINIPVKSTPGALSLSAEEFEGTFGFPKPDINDELVFYCQAGIRSAKAESLAETCGYQLRANYPGSYNDWLAHQK